MKLRQLKFQFSAEHDRLLLRIATHEGKELLFWLTRRCVRLLWPLLVDMARSNPRIALQSDPDARAALLGFEHEQALLTADFTRPYEESTRERPFGNEPLLVARIHRGKDASGKHLLSLSPVSDQRVEIGLDDVLLHSFCRLLQKAVAEADWDLDVSLPRAFVPVSRRAAPLIN